MLRSPPPAGVSKHARPRSTDNSSFLLLATAIGTSINAMATGGVLVGRFVGARFGRYAEMVGGVALIALGAGILFEHLTA